MVRVYGDYLSGNCYKVKLVLSFLNKEYDWIPIDILNGGTQTEEFTKVNPNKKIPAVELEDGRVLCESNAIIGYFAEGTHLLPQDAYQRAKVYEWLFFEQYSHEPFIAVSRFIQKYLGLPQNEKARYESLRPGGQKALKIMDDVLAKNQFLVGESLTIADIALFAYTHIADEGGFKLDDYPNIVRWIEKVKKQNGFCEMV